MRPIVSCCGSPCEKLAWLCTHILSELLNYVPSHLNNIFEHLNKLTDIPPAQLEGKKFCSGDISSLYTNLSIEACIDDVINMAAEHIDSLDLLGLKLIDLHLMLELVLSSSYFTFAGRLYQQLIGLFMSCKPSPICAVVRVYTFEKRIIYVDPHYLTLSYGRYIDDAFTITDNKELAVSIFNSISAQDPDGRIRWEVEFPISDSVFVPFLGTQISVVDDSIAYKFFRKPENKNITLHYKSHHPLKTKVEVTKNFYRVAERSSSSAELAEESFKIIDHLLRCNGYRNPRMFKDIQLPNVRGYSRNKDDTVYLKLPYISEDLSNQICKFIRRHKLPVTVIFTPGTKLREIFRRSRPYDKPQCNVNNCNVCTRLHEDNDCSVKAAVYCITCKLCNQRYLGETGRTIHERLSEHLRYANNPTSNSYSDEALAQHYANFHPSALSDLSFSILCKETNVIKRKILESYFINHLKPEINNRDECISVKRFLII